MCSGDLKIKKVSSTYLLYKTGLKSGGHSFSHFLSQWHIKALARVGPSGLPIATPSICLYNVPLKKKCMSSVANSNNFLKCCGLKKLSLFLYEHLKGSKTSPLWSAKFLKDSSTHISIVSFNGIWVNKDLTSKLAMTLSVASKSVISSANENQSETVYAFLVMGLFTFLS